MKESNFPEEYNMNEIPNEADSVVEEAYIEDVQKDIFDSDEAYIRGPEETATEFQFDEEFTLSDQDLPAVSEPHDEPVAAEYAVNSPEVQNPEDSEFLPKEVFTAQKDDTPSEEPLPLEVPVEDPAPVRKERIIRKGRPKRKKGPGLLGIPHILSAVVWLLIIVAIGTTLGRFLWVCASDVLAFGRKDQDVTISVTTADTMESIAEKLYNAGLVRYPKLFLLYADLTDAEEDITTGTFTLNTVYDYHALVNQMSPRSGARVVVEDVLIPEGYNCRQIFALLEEKGICKAADLEKWAAEGELSDYWFLEGVDRGHKYCLEGFLFPDTYDFYENSTPRAALEKMLNGFDYRFNEKMREQIPVLNERLTEMMRKNGDSEEFIADNQFTIRDVVNVASLIEKETASNQESYRIASVIYNRLFNWGSTPRLLNIDATIIYALGGKTDLTSQDMTVDSPYNTYINTGLTPGPIANPGLASMEAALNPESTSYYYYVLDPSSGVHQFSKTLAEHEKKIKQLYGG